MRTVRCHFALPILGLFAALLAGCGGNADRTFNVVVIGTADAPFQTGARLPLAAQLVRNATAEGLVGFDEQGRVIPALADRWIVTDGGRSYIFRLRDGTWPGGGAIDAQGAGESLRRSLAQLNSTPLSRDLDGIESVRIMAGRVIELRLSRPMPDLLQLLAQPELGMPYKAKGSGPMELVREKSAALLKPIPPERRGLPSIDGWQDRHRNLELRALPAAEAFAAFDEGSADIVLGGRIDQFPAINGSGLLRGTIRLDPVAGLFGLSVQHADGFLSKPENREAIAMAIDRDSLISQFGVGGWIASSRIVSPGLLGDPGTVGERWTNLRLEQRRAEASARVARWKAQTGRNPPGKSSNGKAIAASTVIIRIAMPDGTGGMILFERLAQDLKLIGIDARKVKEAAPADLRLIDVVARYPRMNWYFNQLSCAASLGICSKEADSDVAASQAVPDPAREAGLLAQAEVELTNANVFIPFGPPIRWSLVRGDAVGYAENRSGFHPLMPMAARPR